MKRYIKFVVTLDTKEEMDREIISAVKKYLPALKKANIEFAGLIAPNNKLESYLPEMALLALRSVLSCGENEYFEAFMDGYFECAGIVINDDKQPIKKA